MPLCTKFSETSSNSSSDIKQKPFQMTVNDLHNLENKVKVTMFEFVLWLALVVLCTEFGESLSNISSGLCLALVVLCTEFGESLSNISSDIERK